MPDAVGVRNSGAARPPPQFDAVIARATDVFWSFGYYGTKLPDLLAATEIARGSLYSAFGDKHGLFLRALDRYIDDALARLDIELYPDRDALADLRACLAGDVDRTSGGAGTRGCLVVATAMKLAPMIPRSNAVSGDSSRPWKPVCRPR
jgi:TetR/AcrR family transcriptional repressor of nem operon